MKYDLSSYFIFFRPFMKVKNIYTYNKILYFKLMGLFLIRQIMWGLRDRAIWLAERGVIDSQLPVDFVVCFCFLLELIFTQKNSVACSLFTTAIDKHPPNPSPPWAHLLSQLQRGWRWRSRTRWKSGWGLL